MSDKKKKKILLVEDDHLIASSEELILKSFGYDVIVIDNGNDAIDTAGTDSGINLILMDIGLGDGLNGFDTAKKILKNRDIPVIFYTSYSGGNLFRQLDEIPHYGFLPKSSDEIILQSAIQTALRLFEEKIRLKAEVEGTLHEKESKYQAIFLSSPDSISVTSMDGTYVDINNSYARLTGFTREDVIGKRVSEIGIWVHKRDLNRLMKEIKKTGYIENMEAMFRCKDGSLKKSFISSQIITLNTIPHILSITRNFTERFIAEEALRKSEANLAEAQAIAHMGSWENNFSEKRITWSDEMFRIFGIDPADGAPRNAHEFMKLVHPGDRERVFEYESGSIFENKPFSSELRIVRTDGTVRWIESRGKPEYDRNRKLIRIVGTILDISDRKKAEDALRLSEARLAAAQARANLGSWEYIPEQRSLIWSDEMYRIFDIDRKSDPISSIENLISKIHPLDKDRIVDEETRALKDKKSFRFNYRIIQNNGSERWLESHGEPVLDMDGNLSRFVGTVLDITDWKKTDDALRRNEASLAAAQARAHLGSWEFNIPENRSAWSEEMFRIFGIDKADTPAGLHEVAPYIHPHDREEALRHEMSAVRENRPFRSQYRIIRPDGTIRWVESQGEPTYDENRMLSRITGTVLDITDWKNATEALRISEANLADAQARARLGSWNIDYSSGQVEWSNEMYRLFGLNPAKGPLANVDELALVMYPDDIEKVRNNELRVVKNGESIKSEYRIIRQNDNEIRWMESSLDPVFDESGRVTGIVGTALDITDRKHAEDALKESEEKFRSIAENMIDVIFINDETGRILYLSDSVINMIGYRPDEMEGHFFREYLADGEIERIYPYFEQSVATRTPAKNIEFRVRRKDGSIFYAELNSSVIIKDGRMNGHMGLIRDVTERKAAEEKIKSLLNEKETLLKEVHHRIKNNMSVMISLLSLQAENLKDSQVVSALMDARARMQSMGVLYDKLYRTESFSHMPLKMYMIPLLDEIMRMFPRRIPVTVETDIEDIELSYKQLSSIGIMTTEIITNALKHAFKGRENGAINVSSLSKENRVSIMFRDNGTGIPDTIDLDHTTGFGLQLVRLLTLQIKGEIRIERTEGTAFVLEFNI